MGDADNALREEIEKVRERARLQALAQGHGPDAAILQGNAAVEDFCSRWGIRPEVVGAGVLGGRRPASATAPAHREDSRKVDLGASPLRTSSNPGQTQAIRIADLLKRAKEAEKPSPPPAASAPPSTPPAPARPGSNLSALLQRMRTAEASSTLAAAPASPAAPPPLPPRPAPPASPAAVQRVPTSGDPLGGGGTLSANAERRRQVLEEFDRTYAEVQAMLEQRIGIVDIALNEVPRGGAGAAPRAPGDGLRTADMEALASDVQRLRQNLASMMQVCDEFLRSVGEAGGSRPGGR